MDTLPNEIVCQILSHCDANDIFHFGKTCKRSALLCHDLNFWNLRAINEFRVALPLNSDSTPYEQYRRNQIRYYMSRVPRSVPSSPCAGMWQILYYSWLPQILPDGSVSHY